MPETPLNPFRDTPPGLNPKEDPFFQDFVPGYQPQEAAQPEQEQPEVPTNTEQGLTASKEEVEAYDNQLVMCAGIEVTRNQEKEIKQIIVNLNNDREKKGLEPVELGREITLHKVEIGGMTKEELKDALKQASIQISDYAQRILDSKDFNIQEQKEQIILIQLTVADLGFSRGSITEEVFNKAIELGMGPCPAETGPQWRLQYPDQSDNSFISIGMKRIRDSLGDIGVFDLEKDSNGLWLASTSWDNNRWHPLDSLVFGVAHLST